MSRPTQSSAPAVRQAEPAAKLGECQRQETARTNLLPDFCSLPMVLAVVVYGELLAILLALASPAALTTFWTRMGPLSVFVQLIALLSAGMLCLSRRSLRRVDAPLAALIAWGLILGASALVSLSAAALLPPPIDRALFPGDGAAGLVTRALGITAIVGVLLLRYLYLHQQWRSQVEAVANARFHALQARIRPHFLFNSMNTIANLTQRDPQLAEETILDLADLFRAAMATDATTTTLNAELELAKGYLSIESQRLGSRMKVIWDIDQLPPEAILPPLILQPLVENAVYHGIQPSSQPGTIKIAGHCRSGRIVLTISNSLPPTNAAGHSRPTGNRIAVSNVSQRMEVMFPGQASVTHSAHDGVYSVRLVFPHPWRQA